MDTGSTLAHYPIQNTVPSIPSAGIFQNGYRGLVWCKSIFSMLFGYFDKAMSTPYSGQVFPTGSAQVGNGQAFPF